VLSVYLYSNSNEVHNLELLDNESENATIICPHPMAADAIRSKMSDPSRVEVITISKFSSDLLGEIDPELVAKRKADLLGQLATIWKKKLSSFSADSFFDSFNLFTELRGYTLDFEMVKEVLPFYDEAIQKSLPVYWMYLEQLELVDEHKANEILTHHLKEGDVEKKEKTYIFWGFNHINSGQIDFINALGIRNKVYIPFSKEVFKQSRGFDWIRWFRADELDEEVVEFKKSVESYFFPKKRLASKLLEIEQDNKISEILLGEKKVSLDSCLEASVISSNFRTNADLFSSYNKRIFDKVEKFVGEEVSSEELLAFIDESLNTCLKREFERKDFRLIKVYKLLKDVLSDYVALSSDNEVIKFYDIQVIREIIQLNFPRDYFIPIGSDQTKCPIFGLNELENCGTTKSPIFVVSEDYQGVKKGGSRYQEDVIKFLSALGPIQRPELEFLIVREKFRELINESGFRFCLQEGLMDSDRNWNDFLKGIEFSEIELSSPKEIVKKDFLNQKFSSFTGKVSASKLQSYLDCPRKFYYSFIDRKEIEVSNSKEIRPNEIGSLEHEVIEAYFKKSKIWDEPIFKEVVENTYAEFIKENRKHLNDMKEKLSLYEIYNYSESGIKFVLNILDNLPGSTVEFETSLAEGSDVSGRIDCLIKYEDKFVILDFKRSGFSIPTKSDIEKFNKIQLPFYLNYFGGDLSSVIFWGFVNLSEPEASLVINGGHDLSKELMSNVGLSSSSRKSGFDQISDWFEDYSDFEKEAIGNLFKESEWKANPRKDDVCTFCSVSNLCTRGSNQ